MADTEQIRQQTAAQPLDRDNDGAILYTEDIISYIRKELERRRIDRSPFELQWTLNANFLSGNQMCDINSYTSTIEQYAPLYSWQEHNSYNKILPLYETRIALLSTITYDMTVKPRTNELDDYEKALVSTELLRFTQDATDFDAKRIQALSWAELTGTAFWLSWWDKSAGDMVDEGLYTGDLKYGLLSPYEVFPESVYKQNVEDQRSIIVEQVMTVDDIYDVYGIDVEGDSISTYALVPIATGGGAGYESTALTYMEKTVEDSQYVITFYERPSRRHPKGRMAVIIGDIIFYYGSLPYKSIPIVAQKSKDISGVFYGKSPIETLIPLQRAYNGVKNKIYDYIKTIAANTILAEEGSIDIDEYIDNGTSPGGVVSYNGAKPDFIKYDELPQSIFQQEQQIVTDMEYSCGVSQLAASGNTPNGIDSGKAIANLQKIDNTRLSNTGENARNAIKALAKIWLEIYKSFVKGYRIANIVGSNDAGAILTWCSDTINSYDISFDAENELIMSPEAQKENFLAAYQMGLFADENGVISKQFKSKALEMMKIGSYTEIMGETELQKQNARAENSYFEQGVIPETDEFDDHDIHIDEHRRYVLQRRFQILKRKNPEMAQTFVFHIKAHEGEIAKMNAIAQQQMMLMQQGEKNGQGKT